ncbi:hypothetical protein GCT13_14730 [Paraburkholderia sp. CNPSo 3157]|uniref:Uncharacterized protein n=1 Tax=Paraburkholderia franconis TaxID=2654983 RepID=A0A7X1NA13_9BURK|nr:hypothetical protein [Paraburkholderia franconis]MPW18142.1 hypothetical protein [Paraburkholderia franconis]
MPGILALSIVTAGASAAIHRDASDFATQVDPAIAPVVPETSGYDALLRQYGVEPGSEKARTVLKWVGRIRNDPVIARNLPDGADGVGEVFLDPAKRQVLMSDGVARLDAADRLQYVLLVTRLIDELVPVNCYGLSDMSAVMRRVQLQDMSDADVDQYLGLLYKVVARYASGAPIQMPTREQSAAAEAQLSRGIVAELQGDPDSLDRYAYYASHASEATPADTCWMSRVTMHAIIVMPDPERDYVLLPSIRDRDDAAAQGNRFPDKAQPASAGPQTHAP